MIKEQDINDSVSAMSHNEVKQDCKRKNSQKKSSYNKLQLESTGKCWFYKSTYIKTSKGKL